MRLGALFAWRRLHPPAEPINLKQPRRETLREIGSTLQSRREAEGLSMRELARETRITTPVIEALERGWSDRLPERAYLASMLPQLEQRLALPGGTLAPVLPPVAEQRRTGGRGLGRFTLGSIDVFTTWQGSVVYGVVMVLSLMALNRQQHDIAARNSLSFAPVPADLSSLHQPDALRVPEEQLQALRPLQQALERKPLDWLRSSTVVTSSRVGVLSVTLTQPRELELISGGDDRISLSATPGTLSLQLSLPLELKLKPDGVDADQVLWNGEPVTPEEGGTGLYRVALTRADAPSLDRPQVVPLSP